MTGPEHFKTAEILLDDARLETDGGVEQVAMLARAQVHATLALVAVSFIDPELRGGLGNLGSDWNQALGVYTKS